MGQIRKRGSIWWIRYYRGGKRYEESTESTSYTTAKARLAEREGDIAKGIPVSPQRLTFDDAMAHLLDHYRLKQRKSLDAAERRITKHLTPFFGGRRMTAITTDLVTAYAAERLAAGAAHASVNRELALLKLAFNLSLKARRLLYKPHIEMLAEDNVRTGFFEREQFDAVHTHLSADLRPLVTFMYLTGWRKGEALSLDWRQVDFKAGTVTLDVGRTKSKAGRVFPFADLPELADLLTTQRATTKALEQATATIIPAVFHRKGKRIARFEGAWRAACTAAGCPGRIPHDFRRTAVRNLVRAGIPEQTAMRLTGHKTRSVFDRYDIVTETDLRAAVRKLAGTKQGQSSANAAS